MCRLTLLLAACFGVVACASGSGRSTHGSERSTHGSERSTHGSGTVVTATHQLATTESNATVSLRR
jgi:hypothetical protein